MSKSSSEYSAASASANSHYRNDNNLRFDRHWLMVAAAFAAFAIVFCIAHSAHFLMRIIGSYAGIVVARLLCIFVAAKAVSMVLSGMEEFLVRVSILTEKCS